MIKSLREIKVLWVFIGVDHICSSLLEESLRRFEKETDLEVSIGFQKAKKWDQGWELKGKSVIWRNSITKAWQWETLENI